MWAFGGILTRGYFPISTAHLQSNTHISVTFISHHSCILVPNRKRTPRSKLTLHSSDDDIKQQSLVTHSSEVYPESSSTANIKENTRSKVVKNYTEALELFRQGKTKAACGLLEQCIKMDPTDSHSWLALARFQSRLEPATTLAIQTFENAIINCPDNVHLLQAFGVEQGRRGHFDRARALFASAKDLQPENSYVYQAWGLLEQRAGNRHRARMLFFKSVKINKQPEVCQAWAELESRDGEFDRARELYRAAFRATDKSYRESAMDRRERTKAWILRSWAEMEEQQGDIIRARELLEQALQHGKNRTETRMAIARFQARHGTVQAAVESLRESCLGREQATSNVYNGWATLEARAGNINRARELLREAHEMYPSDSSLLHTWGDVEQKDKNYEAARDLYRRSTNVAPRSMTLVSWALLEARLHSYEDARNLFERALELEPSHGPAYNAYAMMEQHLDRIEYARAVYERAIVRNAATVSVYHGYATLEARLNRFDKARELFSKGVRLTREDSSFLWHSWGMMELKQRRVHEAERVLTIARRRFPNNSQILLASGLTSAFGTSDHPSDTNRARAFFKRAVSSDPKHAHAWQVWGVFELRQQNVAGARALFNRGLSLNPSHGALWQALAMLESREGDSVKARSLFESGIKACPKHIHLLQAWACLEVRSLDIERARELLATALEIDGAHGAVYAAYGLLESQFGTLERARTCFSNGISRCPQHVQLYRTWGQVEFRARNYARARDLYEQGLKLDPYHAPLYHSAAELEGFIGNFGALNELQLRAKKYFGSAGTQSADDVKLVLKDNDSGSDSNELDLEEYTERDLLFTTDMEMALRSILEDDQQPNDNSNNVEKLFPLKSPLKSNQINSNESESGSESESLTSPPTI